jgi:DNA mismatch repair protein MutL
MPNIIRLLPDSIANQIAAGEVVQRPASVVKELLENSIDAHATQIKLIIKEAGRSLIQIIDNGSGMSEVDARMCFEKHATSKLNSSEDLFNLRTMGFRGEALASIAAIAHVDLESCDGSSDIGTRVVVEGSKIKGQSSIASKKGTKTSVKNIFFNIPARRNFLKSNTVENKHILDEFIFIALAHPNIELFLYQEDREVYHLPISKLSQRIVNIFGENYKNQLIPCNQQSELISISGYIGKPNYAKKTRGDQFLYVNKRYIKSAQLNHAIKSAYDKLIPIDVFPFYVIFIDIKPHLVDVNVHPSKTEVKFEDDSLVYSMLHSVAKKSLSVYQVAPSIDFTQEANFNIIKPIQFTNGNNFSYKEKSYAQFRNTETNDNLESAWNSIIENAEKKPEPTQILLDSKINIISDGISPDLNSRMIQLHAKYILFQTKSYLMLIDQCAAHKRILFESYLNSVRNGSGKMQQLLFPTHISLSPADLALLEGHKQDLNKLGFEIETFGKHNIIITACPTEVQDIDLQNTIETLLESLKWNKNNLSISIQENIALAAANSSAVKCGKILEQAEMKSIIDRLFACSNPNHSPDNKKVFVSLSIEDIEEIFEK